MKALFVTAAAALFSLAGEAASGASFKVSSISWVGDALRIEVRTDVPDGTELNIAISDEKSGDHVISDLKFATVTDGKFVADGFATDTNDRPFRAGRYCLSIGKETNLLPLAAVPITIPKHKESVASQKRKAADDDEEIASEGADNKLSRKKSSSDEEHSDALSEPVTNDQIQRLQGLNRSAEIVLVGRDRKAVEERDEAGAASDEMAMEKLEKAGTLIVVKSGTKVKVISLDYSNPILAEIRILPPREVDLAPIKPF